MDLTRDLELLEARAKKKRKKLSKKAAKKARDERKGKLPDLPAGTILILELERRVRYSSSGTGAGRVTKKRVEVVKPSGSSRWSYLVKATSGKKQRYTLHFEKGEPVSLTGQKADYDVLGWERAKPRKKSKSDKAAATKQRSHRPTASGDCYEAAVNYLIQHGIFGKKKKLKLVHGEVMGQGPLEGITFGHAWILDGNMVIDQSNGRDVRMPKDAYYRLGRIDEIGNTHEYTLEQARRKLLEHQTYGPWDLKTETGL